MAVAVAATLAGPADPQVVQLAVTGLTVGQAFTVTGAVTGLSWTVRGADGAVPAATSLILTDVFAPLTEVTYTVTTGAETATDTITVPGDRYVLQSMDGRTSFPFVWHDKGDQRDLAERVDVFAIPGRPDPVVRWDVTGGESGRIVARMSAATSAALIEHKRTRGPLLVLRTDGALLGIPASAYMVVTSASRVLWGAMTLTGLSTDRVWSLGVQFIADPEPSTIAAVSNWDDLDGVYVALDWDDFNAEWAALTWDDFDATDWSTR